MKTIKKMKVSSLLIGIFCFVSQVCMAQSSIGWRGENRDGIYHESGLLKIWAKEGPELLWLAEGIGKGYSTPTVYGDKVFLTGLSEDGEQEVFSAYTLKGEKLYQVPFGSSWVASFPDSRSTPTIIGNKAYVTSGIGEVVCFNIADGKIIWSVDGKTKLQKLCGKWGTAESPLIVDNKVIYSPGGSQTTMVALDAATGELIWQTESLSDTSSYTSPFLIRYKGKQQIVGFTTCSMYGVNPDNGEIQWTFATWDFDTTGGMDGICSNTPLFKDGRLFVANAYDMNSFMFELNDDMTEVKLLWRNSDFSPHTGGMVLVDGIVYGTKFINNGSGEWVAIDWNSGTTRYKTPWEEKSKGSIIAADNMLYCYDERRGTMALVNANPEKFDIVSEFRVPHGNGAHWAHPAIHDGILYVRHGDALMAYKVK